MKRTAPMQVEEEKKKEIKESVRHFKVDFLVSKNRKLWKSRYQDLSSSSFLEVSKAAFYLQLECEWL